MLVSDTALPCSPGNCQSPAVTQALLELRTRATTLLPSSTVLVVRKHRFALPARFHFNFLFDGLSTQSPRRAVIYTNARASFENNITLSYWKWWRANNYGFIQSTGKIMYKYTVDLVSFKPCSTSGTSVYQILLY